MRARVAATCLGHRSCRGTERLELAEDRSTSSVVATEMRAEGGVEIGEPPLRRATSDLLAHCDALDVAITSSSSSNRRVM